MQGQHWSGEELLRKLQDFEKELRAAGLADNTVNTYVGRADTFIRWLRGEYSPVGPNSRSPRRSVRSTMRGQALLDELAQTIDADQITRTLADYAAVTAYDASLKQLYHVTGGRSPDLSIDDHRVAVIAWLRGWGCRHLRRSDTAQTSEVLGTWWAKRANGLPAESKTIDQLTPEDLDAIELAYEDLRTRGAAIRSLRNRDVDVEFGPTAAAKTLFVVRPQACPPWDEPIRRAFGWTEGTGSQYADFVGRAGVALSYLAPRLGVRAEELPSKLKRPRSTSAKIIDEYLWVKITRGL